jgi:predicted phage-related endonuclease
LIEVKTARYEDQWKQTESGDDIVPPTYRAQVLWYLQTFGMQKAKVVVLFSGSKPRVFEVTNDQFEADANLAKVTEFMAEYVNKETLPPFSAPFTSTLETVRYMHPDIEDNEVELGIEGVDYFEALRELEKAQAAVDLCKADIMTRMGKAKRGMLNGQWVLTRQARGGGAPFLVNKK